MQHPSHSTDTPSRTRDGSANNPGLATALTIRPVPVAFSPHATADVLRRLVPVNDNDPRRIIANLQAFWAEVFATRPADGTVGS